MKSQNADIPTRALDRGTPLAGGRTKAGARIAGAYAIIGGAVTIAGWTFSNPRLMDWTRSGIIMKPNTAVCAMAAGIALIAATFTLSRKNPGRIGAALVVMVGGLTLLEHLTGWNFRIDTLLFDEPPGAVATAAPGRMGPPASLSFTLLGTALLLLTGGPRARRWASALGIAVISIASLPVVGYLYSAGQLYTLPRLTGIALETASILVALGAGLIAAVPEHGLAAALRRDDAGGGVLRRLILPILFFPMIAGWFRLRGQQAGLYDVAFGSAARTLVEILGLLGSMWWVARSLSRTDQQVRITQRRLETFVAAISDQFIIVDRAWRYVFVNDQVTKVTGKSEKELLGKSIWELFPGLTGTEFERQARQAVDQQRPYQFEYYYPAWDRWFENHFYPSGEGLTLIITEVTTRKKMEAALGASKVREAFLLKLSDALRPLADPVKVQATAGRVLGEHLNSSRVVYFEVHEADYIVEREYARGAAALGGGYPVASLGTRLLASLRDGRTAAATDVAADAGLSPAERAAFKGAQIGAYIGVPLIKGGEFVAGLAVHTSEPRDWTQDEIALVEETAERTWSAVERARAEVSLRESEARLSLLIESAKDYAIFTTDTARRVNGWNAGAEALFGYREADIIGQSADILFTPEDRIAGAAEGEAEKAMTEGRAENERWQSRRDGSLFYGSGLVMPLRDEDGTTIGLVKIIRDLTEHKRAEDALREADRRKDEFLAMLAHELRNPLASIRNAAQVIKLAGSADANLQRAREVIERQMQHLTHLVDDLLDVSRITRGKITLQREPVPLSTIVTRAVETSRPLIDARKHRLTVTVPSDQAEPLRVEGDQTRLVQVVSNLLNNAAKYTDEGGRIAISATAENGQAVIRVRDNGMGLAANLLPRVFDLFTQSERSLDRSQGGLGVGLALVRSLIEMHGGAVEARSEGPGRGSEFIVRLPLLAFTAPADDAAPSDEQELPASNALRVLVVEDNVDSAEMMALILKFQGHAVRTVHDGLQALEAARAFRPQVVLCDIGLPGIDGYEVATRLRTEPEFSEMRLVALTGYGQKEDRGRSKEAGFDYHLTKPVEPNDLEALLDSLGKSAGIL